jgi:hypothetical protein
MEKKYVIVSLKRSTKTETLFWRANDAGYTTNPWQAGIYSEQEVKAQPGYYNDGYNTIAICVTNSTLPDSGVKVLLDEKEVRAYRTQNLGEI